MNNIEEIARLVNELVRAVKAALPPTAHDPIGNIHDELVRAQPVPTEGQLQQLRAIERGEKISTRNPDYKSICLLGYVGERKDGSLCLTRIGQGVLHYYLDLRRSEKE